MDVRSPVTPETSHKEDEESVVSKHHRVRSEDGVTDKHKSSSDKHSREGKSSKHKHKHHKHKHRRKHRKEHIEGSADEIASDKGELVYADGGVHATDDLKADLQLTDSRVDGGIDRHRSSVQEVDAPKARQEIDNSNLTQRHELELTDTMDEDKEEGEILDEEDGIHRSFDSDVEPGEIKTEGIVLKDEGKNENHSKDPSTLKNHSAADRKARSPRNYKTSRSKGQGSTAIKSEQVIAGAPGLESMLGIAEAYESEHGSDGYKVDIAMTNYRVNEVIGAADDADQRRSGEKGDTDDSTMASDSDALEKSQDDLKRKVKKIRTRLSRSPDSYNNKRQNRRSSSREREMNIEGKTGMPLLSSKDILNYASSGISKHHNALSKGDAVFKNHSRKRSRSRESIKEVYRLELTSEIREDDEHHEKYIASTRSEHGTEKNCRRSRSRESGLEARNGKPGDLRMVGADYNRLSREKEREEHSNKYGSRDSFNGSKRRSRSREAAPRHDKGRPDRGGRNHRSRSRETPHDYKDRHEITEKGHRSRSKEGLQDAKYSKDTVTRSERDRRSASRDSSRPCRSTKDGYQRSDCRRRSMSRDDSRSIRDDRERSERERRSRSRETMHDSRSIKDEKERSERERRSRSRDTARESRRLVEEGERSKQSRSREGPYDSRDYRDKESRSRYERRTTRARDDSISGRDRRRSTSRNGRNSLDRRRSQSRTSTRTYSDYTDRRRRSRSKESPRSGRHSRGEGYNRPMDGHIRDVTHDKSSKDVNMHERGVEDGEDNEESMVVHSEDEDVERIKEERRKRQQAILEKYKKQEQLNNDLKESADLEAIVKKEGLAASGAGDAKAAVDENTSVISDDLKKTSFNLDKGAVQIDPLDRPTGTKGLGEGTPKSDKSDDMFSDYIFGDSPVGGRKLVRGDGIALETSGLTDNWDDAEGYYCYRIGEVLDGRYEVASSHGRGVFSTVVRARDLKASGKDSEEVAIKIIRNNEVMFKSGQTELVILKKLAGADPENRRHCVLFLSSFEYRNHLCLVFESLHMNLREILKKFGRNIGLNLSAVRAYAKQLFIALKHLKNCGVLHCDIKPDNMLVNDSKTVLKLCDFGSAMFAGENEITPYLVSRFYRAPEIILGLTYDHPLDMWSVGCCLYEFYTGKVLFPGPTNNDMLRLHMELKGPFPKKMLKKAAFASKHFDQDYNFCAVEEDPVTKTNIKRILVNVKPKDIGSLVTGQSTSEEDIKLLTNFKDILEKIFMLDPEKRITVSQALSHPFITGK